MKQMKRVGLLMVHIGLIMGLLTYGSIIYAADATPVPVDPYEKFNRVMFTFNQKFDEFFIKPLAILYIKIIPKPLNKGIHNFFVNLNHVPYIANDILQLRFQQTAHDAWRLLINTTLGIGGLFDIASRIDLNLRPNDFGLTLARWGYIDSAYLVLPFAGPMTIRDGIGIPVDYYGFSVYPSIQDDGWQYGIYALSLLDKRVQLLHYQPILEEAAIDKYSFVRDAYLQRRHHLLEEITQNASLENESY